MNDARDRRDPRDHLELREELLRHTGRSVRDLDLRLSGQEGDRRLKGRVGRAVDGQDRDHRRDPDRDAHSREQQPEAMTTKMGSADERVEGQAGAHGPITEPATTP